MCNNEVHDVDIPDTNMSIEVGSGSSFLSRGHPSPCRHTPVVMVHTWLAERGVCQLVVYPHGRHLATTLGEDKHVSSYNGVELLFMEPNKKYSNSIMRLAVCENG